MYIRAHKSGRVSLALSNTTIEVVRGDLLFHFEDTGEHLELAKTETSLALLMASKERAETMRAPDGAYLRSLAAEINRSQYLVETFENISAYRNEEARTGAIDSWVYEQSVMLKQQAKRDLFDVRLEASQKITGLDETVRLLPLLLKKNELIRDQQRKNIERLQIRSPASGKIILYQKRDGWVKQGDLLASIGGD